VNQNNSPFDLLEQPLFFDPTSQKLPAVSPEAKKTQKILTISTKAGVK
jgi:hypothetical protein